MTEAELEAAIVAMRGATLDLPSAAQREEIRTALLARARPPARPRGMRWVAAPVAAAAAMVTVLAWPAPARSPVALPPLPTRGHVHPGPGAVFAATSPLPDEIVALHDGTIHLEVEPLRAAERFRVVVGGSEVEVRGTAFEVTAARDRLIDVHVLRGRVEVRPAGRAMVVLFGGDAWVAPVVAAPVVAAPVVAAPVVPAPITAAAVRPMPSAPLPPRAHVEVTPAAAPATPDQQAYNEGWAALRGAQFELASAAFGEALALAPTGGLADDARFWRAVALARGHAPGPAITAFRELVDQHPGSMHAGEASAMLGWLLVDHPKWLDEARARFTAALDDPSAKVRASARAGIEALDRPKP